MNREESLQKLKELSARINGCPLKDLYDDGFDCCDRKQNMRFVAVCRRLEKISKELAFVDPDCIPTETLDRLWKEAWGKRAMLVSPETKYFHHIEYIKLLEQELKK